MSQIQASHILVKHQYEAEDLLKKLAQGEEFSELAKKFSTCPSSRAGGDLGLFGRGQMVPAFEEAAFGLDVADA